MTVTVTVAVTVTVTSPGVCRPVLSSKVVLSCLCLLLIFSKGCFSRLERDSVDVGLLFAPFLVLLFSIYTPLHDNGKVVIGIERGARRTGHLYLYLALPKPSITRFADLVPAR